MTHDSEVLWIWGFVIMPDWCTWFTQSEVIELSMFRFSIKGVAIMWQLSYLIAITFSLTKISSTWEYQFLYVLMSDRCFMYLFFIFTVKLSIMSITECLMSAFCLCRVYWWLENWLMVVETALAVHILRSGLPLLSCFCR